MGHKTENVELTVLCLIQYGNRLLLQNRVKEDWKGYTFPGGHVEAGESFVDAVVREMREETGLEILNPRIVGIKQFPITDGRYIVLLYKATEFIGTVVSSDEGEMEWVDIDKLSEVNVVEDFHDLMKVIDDPDLNEFQYTIEDGEWIVHLK
jgi:8-oxo-dGTP diphosphatase